MTSVKAGIADAVVNLKVAANHAENAAAASTQANCALIDALAVIVKALPPTDASDADRVRNVARIQHPAALLVRHLRVALGQDAPDDATARQIVAALSDAMIGDGWGGMLGDASRNAASVAEQLRLVLSEMTTTVDLLHIQSEIQELAEEARDED